MVSQPYIHETTKTARAPLFYQPVPCSLSYKEKEASVTWPVERVRKRKMGLSSPISHIKLCVNVRTLFTVQRPRCLR